MNNTLPIVVLPSRLRWGFWALLAAAMFAGLIYWLATSDFEERKYGLHSGLWNALPVVGRRLFVYATTAIAGYAMILAGWNCIVAPPRMIIDEGGVGGRFIGGGFVGAKRVAWDDIIGARLVERYVNHKTLRYLVLGVNNTGGKYRPAQKWRSAIAGRDKDFAFAFDITHSKLNNEQAREVAAVIISRAKGKPQEAEKPPFAAG